MTKDLTHARIALVPIDEISVGLRRRQRLTKITALAESIAADGLAHPIIVRNGNELVCGARRLAACRRLGWTEIPARRVEQMTDEEVQRLELHENEERVDLDDFETSKMRVAEIAAEATAKGQEVSSKSEKISKGKGGRPAKREVSRAKIAEATGISPTEQIRIEEHVQLAARYPAFQRPEWKKHQVLAAGEELEALPARERPVVGALIDRDHLAPTQAIEILTNFAGMAPSWRRSVLKMARDPDEAVRIKALTTAAKLPPPLDPRHLRLLEMVRHLRAMERVRDDKYRPRLAKVREALESVAAAITADYQAEKARFLSGKAQVAPPIGATPGANMTANTAPKGDDS